METRVRQELLKGEVTEQADVLEVAAAHLDKDIRDDGMTVEVDANGCVRITQIIGKSGAVNERSSSGDSGTQIVCTTLLLADKDGNIETSTDYVYDSMQSSNSGSLSQYSVYATHTVYLLARSNELYSNTEIKLTSMKTVLTYGTAIKAGKLVQQYKARRDFVSDVASDSKTINNPAAGTHSFAPSGCLWYNVASGTVGGYVAGYAIVSVGSSSFVVEAGVSLVDLSELEGT